MKSSLFSDDDFTWKKEWQDMPEFSLKDLTPFKSIQIHFACREDMKEFATLIGQEITMKTNSRWFPKNDHKGRFTNKRYVDENDVE